MPVSAVTDLHGLQFTMVAVLAFNSVLDQPMCLECTLLNIYVHNTLTIYALADCCCVCCCFTLYMIRSICILLTSMATL
jgi:hypothetical protein